MLPPTSLQRVTSQARSMTPKVEMDMMGELMPKIPHPMQAAEAIAIAHMFPKPASKGPRKLTAWLRAEAFTALEATWFHEDLGREVAMQVLA